jgi:intraflagellar transport protein 80
LVVDNVSIWIYTYTGRLHLNPRYPASQAQVFYLTQQTISMGVDVLAVRDFADQSVAHVFDLLPGASRQEDPYQVKHKQLITDISVNRAGSADDQYLVFIDSNRDLYLTAVRSGPDFSLHKIGTQVTSVMWSSECNVLVGLHDSCYSIWYCPGEACSDPSLIALTTLSHDTTEFGKNISLVSFDGLTITLCASGSNFTVSAKIYCILIHKLVSENQWEKALKICRMGQSTLLWACLAALSSKRNQLEISEEAYSSALQIDKVDYMTFVKDLNESEQMAENAVMNGARIEEAETILLHNRKVSEAIQFCMRLHRWRRALEIADKHSTDLRLVLKERMKYLTALQKVESDNEFIKMNAKVLSGGESRDSN